MRKLVVVSLFLLTLEASAFAQSKMGSSTPAGTDSNGPSPLAQVNLEQPSYNEYPFINLVKSNDRWWVRGNGDFTVLDPAGFDSDGYPKYDANSLKHFGWAIQVSIPFQYARAGHYALTWTGAGEFSALKELPDPYGGGSIAAISCRGSTPTPYGGCDNTGCNTGQEMRGFIVGTMLTITSPDAQCGDLVAGEPVSGRGVTVTRFGTPTIITSKTNSTHYTVNFAQKVGSVSNPIAINPGGRFEFSISGEKLSSIGIPHSLFNIDLVKTGTATDPTNTAQSIALVYTCLNTGNCDGRDDEKVYWSGQIVGTKLQDVLEGAGIGVIRDLGFSQNVFNGLTTWASRKPASYFMWDGIEMRNNIFAGTLGGTAADSLSNNPTQQRSSTSSFQASISNGRALNVTGTVTGAKLTNGQYLDAAHIEGYINDGGALSDGKSGNVLTVTAVADGVLAIGQNLYDANRVIYDDHSHGAYTTITTDASNSTPRSCAGSPCTGDGGSGTYLVSASQFVNSSSLFRAKDGTGIINVTNIGVAPFTVIQALAGPSQVKCPNCTGTGGAGTYLLYCGSDGCVQPNVASETMSTVAYRLATRMDSTPPADKETITVEWPTSVANPSTVLLSADGGATYHPILRSSGVYYNMSNEVPVSNHIATLVYDATFGGWLGYGGIYSQCCGPNASVGIPNFVPPEVFIELCNEVHANPWITEPYLAADPMTDYIPQYALFIKNNFPNMRPEFETADETWNIATDNGVFAKTRDWFYSTLDSHWVVDNGDNWAGKTASTMCQTVSAIYGDDTSKYRCIVGVWTNGQWNNLKAANPRLLSSAYVAQSPENIPIQSGCAGPTSGPTAVQQTDCPTPFQQKAAYNWVTEVAPAGYWSPNSQQELANAYKFFYATPDQQAAIMAAYLDTSNSGYITEIWPAFYKWATNCAGHGTPCGVRGLVVYEGSYQAQLTNDETLSIGSANRASPCVINTKLNGAVAGMPIEISRANPSGYDGKYVVGPNPTPTTIPLLQSDGRTPFDCTGLNALVSGSLTYIGSGNYLNYMRNMSYASPSLEVAQKKMYEAFFTFGGGGMSQLNVSAPNKLGNYGGGGLLAMGDDINGYFPVGTCSSCTIADGILTLGGKVTGRFQIGQMLYGANQPSGANAVTIAGYVTGQAPGLGAEAGDKLRLSAGSVKISNARLDSVVHFTLPRLFPSLQGIADYDAEHTENRLKHDGDKR